MNDLQTKLERLTSQATALAPVPEVERVLRRGRRRRRRRAGTALLAVALAGAGTAGIWQAQRATDRRTTVAPPPAAASLNAYLGWWQDNIDASLFLRDGISAEQRAALGRRLESEPEVTRVWFESRQQALARWVASGSPGGRGEGDGGGLPGELPGAVARPGQPGQAAGRPVRRRRLPGVQRRARFDRRPARSAVPAAVGPSVGEQGGGERAPGPAAGGARVEALRRELQATPGVTSVTYESRAAAVTRVRAQLGPELAARVDPTGPRGVPASFRLRTRDQATVARVRDALCRNPTGEHDTCADGVLLVVDEAWLEAVP
jgi:hypothetical protein